MHNPNKAVSANQYGIKVFYTDTFKSHNVSYDESSILKEIQTTPVVKYQKSVNKDLTQKILYNHAMYGLKAFTESELKEMTYVKKMKIKEMFDQAQFQLNIWKQELVHNKIGSFLTTLFPKSTFATSMSHFPKAISPWEKTTVTFKELGIRKESIAQKLIDLEILPSNYFQLAH